jgi:hypothetical protein
MARAGHGIRYMAHSKRKASAGVKKVTTPGSDRTRQTPINQPFAQNGGFKVWSAKKLKMRPRICVSCGKKSRSDDCNR